MVLAKSRAATIFVLALPSTVHGRDGKLLDSCPPLAFLIWPPFAY